MQLQRIRLDNFGYKMGKVSNTVYLMFNQCPTKSTSMEVLFVLISHRQKCFRWRATFLFCKHLWPFHLGLIYNPSFLKHEQPQTFRKGGRPLWWGRLKSCSMIYDPLEGCLLLSVYYKMARGSCNSGTKHFSLKVGKANMRFSTMESGIRFLSGILIFCVVI